MKRCQRCIKFVKGTATANACPSCHGARNTTKAMKQCVARDPLLYGSKTCSKEATFGTDLCPAHAERIKPHQLINGILYMDSVES